jgi:hypothetical protein
LWVGGTPAVGEALPRDVATIDVMPRRGPDLVVVSPLKDWTCAACGSTADAELLTLDNRLLRIEARENTLP